ncbi:hypothetical protein FRC11_006649 [Ceratobasidium sp. 423]|nr:hypothetical protein FRC11_006649 [Ceratobasidium sp. 423]
MGGQRIRRPHSALNVEGHGSGALIWRLTGGPTYPSPLSALNSNADTHSASHAPWSTRDAAWIYALSPPEPVPSDDLPKRIDHLISPTTLEFGDDDSDFFLESSSRAEFEKAAHRFKIGPPRGADLAVQKPHPMAHSVPYIPTPGTPFPYQIDPLATSTFSLAFRCVVNIGVRGSEHIRRRVVQAGALGVVSCILAVWLKGKGFAIGPSATGSGAPRESREVRVRRREEALERQRALGLARTLEHTTPSDNPRARAIAQPQPRIATTPVPALALTPVRTSVNPNPSSEEADEEMSGASDMGLSPTPPLPRLDAACPTTRTGATPVSLLSPIVPASPVMGRISPNTAQSSDASANATPVGSGTPTGSVVVPGRDRSGTVVGRPIWDTEGARQAAQPIARPAWSDADEAPAQEVATTITHRPRRERDTDGDDTEADSDDQTAQQGEWRTIGIVDAAGGGGAAAVGMVGGGVGSAGRTTLITREEVDSTVVARSSNTTNTPAAMAVATEVEIPTRRSLTNTVTRTLVDIAGGMTGRTTTNTQ